MKFSAVLVVSLVRSTVPARPAVDVDSVEDGDFLGIDYCTKSRNKEKLKRHCSRPGNTSISTIQDVGTFLTTTEHCDIIKCCAPEAGMKNKQCKCVEAGGAFNGEPLSTDEKCCSKHGHKGVTCGCAEVGETLRFGGSSKSCCSGSYDGQKCVKRECTGTGGTPSDDKPCCRYNINGRERYSSEMDDGKCKCIGFGLKPANLVDIVSAENCCSKKFWNGVCDCISDSQSEIPHGAKYWDCCSSKIVENGGKKYCKDAKCLTGGNKPSGGAVCCSGVKKGELCGCLAPGKKIPEAGAKRSCCSGAADHDDKDKCGHVHVGDTIDTKFMDPSTCSSGKADKNGTCLCIHEGDVSEEASQCCSGWHNKADKKCGCTLAGVRLQNGAEQSDCCSGRAADGVCLCTRPGRPSGRSGQDCCSKSAKDGVCGCFGPKDNITKHEATQCCGGFYDAADVACSCVPAATVVAAFVHDGACCGDASVVGGKCTLGLPKVEEKPLKPLHR